MTYMTCKVLYGYKNMFGSFVPLRSTLITDVIPMARRRARDRARHHTNQNPKYIAEISTLSLENKWINLEVYQGGHELDAYLD